MLKLDTLTGAPPKRQEIQATPDDLDDDELLALAYSQPWPPPAPAQHHGSLFKPGQGLSIKAAAADTHDQQTEQADAAFLLDESALDMDLESPGSRPLASVDEVAACMRKLEIYYDPLAVDGQIMQATAADGTPAFCLVTEPAESQPHVPAPKGSLLSSPISQLLRSLESQNLEKALAACQPVSTQAAKKQQQGQFLHQQQQDHQGQQLWVDKYRPQGFMELLSNEQVNRDVLDWVKAWDCTVFGLPGSTPAPGSRNQHTSGASSESTADQKLLLLSGPPGEAAQVHLLFFLMLTRSSVCVCFLLYPKRMMRSRSTHLSGFAAWQSSLDVNGLPDRVPSRPRSERCSVLLHVKGLPDSRPVKPWQWTMKKSQPCLLLHLEPPGARHCPSLL